MALNIQSIVHSVKMHEYSPNCTVPFKVPAASFAETGKLVLQVLWNMRDSSSTFSGKEQSCRTQHATPFKMYNKATLVKMVCFWPKDRCGIKGVELRAQKYYIMGSFREGHQDLQWGKNGLSNKWCRENHTSTRRRTYLEPLPPTITESSPGGSRT